LAIRPDAASNVSYCEFLGAWSGLASTEYTTNVSALWGKVCVLTTFVSLIDTWGNLKLGLADNNTTYVWDALNLSFQWGGSGNAPPTVYFVTTWLGSCSNLSLAPGPCSNSEYWAGNVTTNNVSGPYFEEHIPISPGPIPFTNPSGRDAVYPGIAVTTGVGVLAVLVVVVKMRKARPPAPSTGPTTMVLESIGSPPEQGGGSGRNVR
jgi:hypothetical protein